MLGVPVETGCDLDCDLVIVNRLLSLALGTVDIAKKSLTLTDSIFFAFLWGEIDRASRRFLRRDGVFVLTHTPRQDSQTLRLLRCFTKSFANFQSLPRLLYPFFAES